jgi:hypothetical protein
MSQEKRKTGIRDIARVGTTISMVLGIAIGILALALAIVEANHSPLSCDLKIIDESIDETKQTKTVSIKIRNNEKYPITIVGVAPHC